LNIGQKLSKKQICENRHTLPVLGQEHLKQVLFFSVLLITFLRNDSLKFTYFLGQIGLERLTYYTIMGNWRAKTSLGLPGIT